jgi:hypothetical protein
MPTAFKATYSDWKLVKTRGVVQIVFEVPLAEADDAYELLGGMPIIAKERWFGIAAIKTPAEEAPSNVPSGSPPSTRPDGTKRMEWRDVQPAAQAGIRCADPVFRLFLDEMHSCQAATPEEAATAVRMICNVESRAELGTNHKARVIWKQLDDEFQAWKALEHA